jgi:hypothetical protein
MRTLKSASISACLFIVLVAAAQVKAEFVTATLDGTGLNDIINPGASVKINYGDGSAPSLDYKPGVVNWTGKSSNSPAFKGKFTTFCLELTQDISPGIAYTFALVCLENAPRPGSSQTGNGMGLTKANEIRTLWTAFHGSLDGDDNKSAAFQLAIWKIEYDWGNGQSATDFTKGNFRASDNGGATNLASGWLINLTQPNSYIPDQNLMALTSDKYQDQLVSVPVPPTISLTCIGLLCLSVYGHFIRRMRRLQYAAAHICAGQ